MRLVLIPVLTALACLMAALYGALHNQISYTIGPDYFHAFKFIQFRISPDLPPRHGAAIVGVQASWWMGLVVGLPIAALCARAPTGGAMVRLFLRCTAIVLAVTLGLGLASLLVPGELLDGLVPIPAAAQNPWGFARAALMHDTSYLAGILGMMAGGFYALRRARR